MNQIATFHRDAAAALRRRTRGHDPSQPVPNPLPKLLTGEDLPIEDSEHLFERLVLGKLEPAEIAGMLIALRMKGETAEEMIGAARALSAAALPFDRPGLSLCRLLRHRRRRIGADQRLDRHRVRRRGLRAADRQARQSQRQLALRLGRRARSASARRSTIRPQRRGRCSTRPASASCSRPPITRA